MKNTLLLILGSLGIIGLGLVLKSDNTSNLTTANTPAANIVPANHIDYLTPNKTFISGLNGAVKLDNSATTGLGNLDVQQTLTINRVPMVYASTTIDEWSAIEDQITNTSAINIIIKTNGFGGMVMMVSTFKNVLRAAQASGKHITIDLTGGNFSGHGYASCYADTVIFEPGSYVMLHAAASENPNGTKNFHLNKGEQLEFADLLSTCASKYHLTLAQVKAIVIQHKALYIYQLAGVMHVDITNDD